MALRLYSELNQTGRITTLNSIGSWDIPPGSGFFRSVSTDPGTSALITLGAGPPRPIGGPMGYAANIDGALVVTRVEVNAIGAATSGGVDLWEPGSPYGRPQYRRRRKAKTGLEGISPLLLMMMMNR